LLFATERIKNTLLEEKYFGVINDIEMLGAALEGDQHRARKDHEQNVIAAIEFLDHIYQVYAAAYKFEDGEFKLITSRNYETSIFEPFDFSEFTEAVLTRKNGRLIFGYIPDKQTFRYLHIYFWRGPSYLPPEEQFVLVAGVSEHSIVTKIPFWVALGQCISIFITFVLQVWLIVLLCILGHVYSRREGEKWRDEWK